MQILLPAHHHQPPWLHPPPPRGLPHRLQLPLSPPLPRNLQWPPHNQVSETFNRICCAVVDATNTKNVFSIMTACQYWCRKNLLEWTKKCSWLGVCDGCSACAGEEMSAVFFLVNFYFVVLCCFFLDSPNDVQTRQQPPPPLNQVSGTVYFS